MVIDNWEVAMVLYIGPAFKHERSGKICHLMARWWNGRVVVSELDGQEHQAHLFPSELMGGWAKLPVIDSIQVGVTGVGCTIYGTTANGTRFRLDAENADFVEGKYLTFTRSSKEPIA